MIFSQLDPAQLDRIRRDLLRFAQIQLPHQPDVAEDLVQEAVLSAYQAQKQFRGDAQLGTWLIGILKNKLRDYFRRQTHQRAIIVSQEEHALDEAFEDCFLPDGHWTEAATPEAWGNPEDSLKTKEFYETLQICLYRLPENTARVFMMAEIIGLTRDEITQQCRISVANFHTVMHRAREGLRQCLQVKWFNGSER